MKRLKQIILSAIAVAAAGMPVVHAQTPPPTPGEVGKALGFSPDEIAQIESGEIVSNLKA